MGWRIGSKCETDHIAVARIDCAAVLEAIRTFVSGDAAGVILSSRAADGETGDIVIATDRVSLLALVGGHVRHRNVVAVGNSRSRFTTVAHEGIIQHTTGDVGRSHDRVADGRPGRFMRKSNESTAVLGAISSSNRTVEQTPRDGNVFIFIVYITDEATMGAVARFAADNGSTTAAVLDGETVNSIGHKTCSEITAGCDVDVTVAVLNENSSNGFADEACCILLIRIDVACHSKILDGSINHMAERSGILLVKPILTGSIADGQRVATTVESASESICIRASHRSDRILCRSDVACQLHGLTAIGAKTIVYT